VWGCDPDAAGLSAGRVLFMLRRGWILMGGLRRLGRLLGSCLRGLGSFEGWGVKDEVYTQMMQNVIFKYLPD